MKRFVVAFLVLLSCAGGLRAETLYFFQQANNLWNNQGNWFVPNPGNPGTFTLAGRTPVPSSDDVEIGTSCDATGVTFQPKNSFTVEALAVVTGGNFDIFNLTFALPKAGTGSNGLTGTVVNIKASGSITFTIANTLLTNCIITLQGGSFVNQNAGVGVSGGTIFNQGSWVQQAGVALTYTGGAARFDNIGDFRGGNGGTSQLSAGSFLTFNNSGTIRADSGTLVINGNLTWEQQDGSGSFYPFTSNAIIMLNGILVVPSNTITYFKGPGVVQANANILVNGTLEVGVPASGPSDSRITAPELAVLETGHAVMSGSATIGGGGLVEINDTSTFDSKGATFIGTASGLPIISVKVKKGGQLNVKGPGNSGQDFVTSFFGTCENHGTVNFNVRQLDSHGFNFINGTDGVVNFQSAMGWINGALPVATFVNQGTLNGLGGTSQNPLVGFGVNYTNSPGATLNVTGTGAFSLYGGGSLSGTIDVTSPIPFNLLSGSFSLNPGLNFKNSKITMSAPVELKGKAAVEIYDWEMRNGALVNGDGTITLLTTSAASGGELAGPVVYNFNPGSVSTFSGPVILNGAVINNSGTCNWTSGDINATNAAIWNNLVGARYDVQTDSAWNTDGTANFNNFTGGTFVKSAGSGITNIGLKFNNDGTVDSRAGTLAFCNFLQNSGAMHLSGGNFSFICGTPGTAYSGTCDGDGTISGDFVIGSKVDKPQFALGPGKPLGKIIINGNFTQGPRATLNIEIAGLTTPGVDYDRLQVSGTATLGGGLNVTNINGFKAGPNDTVVPLTAGSIAGTFASTNAQVTYGGTNIVVAALPVNPAQLLNISTRLQVLTGNNVLIAGFILTGTDQKKVIVRGLGPSVPVSGKLANPTLELHDASTTLAANDDWKESQQAEIEASTIPPRNELESAIVRTLPANNAGYTAILGGKSGGTGIGLLEVYDLAQSANSKLANISTRGFVDTGDNVMIGGLILGPGGNGPARIMVRGIGPSLGPLGINNALQDPFLELHDGNGAQIAANDDWKTGVAGSQQSEIEATTLAPTDDRESALVSTLAPGNYTAIIRGKNNTTGVALVELYNLQ